MDGVEQGGGEPSCDPVPGEVPAVAVHEANPALFRPSNTGIVKLEDYHHDDALSASPDVDDDGPAGQEDDRAAGQEDDGELKPHRGLRAWEKVMFGMGYMPWGMFGSVVGFFQLHFLLEVVQIDAVLVAGMMVVKQAYDAVTDPVVGILSDNTRTRFGRRRPWVLGAVVPLFVVWVAMWTDPPFVRSLPEMALAMYFMVLMLLYSTCNTCCSVPFQSLVPDVAPTYRDRTTVVMCGQMFMLLGSLGATVLWNWLITVIGQHDAGSDGESGNMAGGDAVVTGDGGEATDGAEGGIALAYFIAAVTTGAFMLCSTCIGVYPARERPVEGASRASFGVRALAGSLLSGAKSLVMFPPFLAVSGLHIISYLSTTLFMNNFVLYLEYYLEQDEYQTTLLGVVQLFVVLSIFFWASVSRLIGKRHAFLAGSSLGSLGFACLALLPAGWHVAWTFAILSVIALGSGACFLLPSAMMPDVIQLDESRSQKRREALFYSVFMLFEKCAIGLTIGSSTLVLGLSGYRNPEEQAAAGSIGQSDFVLLMLRILLGVLPAALRLAALPLCWYFPRICAPYGGYEEEYYFKASDGRDGLAEVELEVVQEKAQSDSKAVDVAAHDMPAGRVLDNPDELVGIAL